MRNVKSLSSLSTLAVGTTMVSTSAFSTVPYHHQKHINLPPTHNSYSSLLTQMNAAAVSATAAEDSPLPPSATVMETVVMAPAAQRAPPPPSTVTPSFLADLPWATDNDEDGDEYSTTGFVSSSTSSSSSSLPARTAATAAPLKLEVFVPPGKSLRQKLHLPSTETAAALATASSKRTHNNDHRPRIVGHRGALYQELENTRAAFLACAGDCNAVELDVFVLPKDGSLVVFHGSGTDQNPGLLEDYCTNPPQGATSILDLTYEQTQQLHFNPNFAELPAPKDRILAGKIPTLEQVLIDLKPTGMEVKIELKGKGTAKPSVELVDRLGMVQQVSFSSFNHDEIETVRKMRPQMTDDGSSYVYVTGALFDSVPVDYIQRAQRVGASEIHLKYDECTTERISDIHRSGMGSMCWFRGPIGMKADTTTKYWDIGNEDESCYETLIQTGVQQLCVNRPDVLAGLLRRKEAQQVQEQQLQLQQQRQSQQTQQQLVQDIMSSSGLSAMDLLEFESPPSISQRISA